MGKTTYNLVERKNPVTKQYNFHAQQVRYSNIGATDIVKYAAENSCIDAAMINTVMQAWQQVMRMYFVNGHNVICHPLGSFVSTIRSKATETAEEFSAANINGLYLTFRPGRDLRIAKDLKNNSLVRKDLA